MRHFTGILCLILLLFSCRDRVICPAFQSTYILDDSVRIAYFSYIWELDDQDRINILEQRSAQSDSINELGGGIIALSDTTRTDSLQQESKIDYYAYVEDFVVPPRDVRKNKYGIIKYEPYWLKNYFLKSAPMENILTPEPEDLGIEPLADEGLLALDLDPDSTLSPISALDSSALAVADSAVSPDAEVLALAEAPEDKGPRFLFKYDPEDNFNVEQQYYNKWYGQQLIYQPRPPKSEIEPLATDSLVTDVEPVDPSNIVDEPIEQSVPDDEVVSETEDTPPVEEVPPPSPPPANEPVIEGENDDLGF